MKPTILMIAAVTVTTVSWAVLAPAAHAAPAADLTVAQSATPQPTGALSVVVTVHNGGPSAAGQVTLTELLAGTGITGSTHTSNNANTTCMPVTAPPGFNRANQCTVPQIVPGRTWKLTYTIDAPTGTAIKAQAAAQGTTADPNTADNTSVVMSWAGPVTDLGLTFGSRTRPDADQKVIASVIVTNNGPNSSGVVEIKTTAGQFVALLGIQCPELNKPSVCVLPNSLAPGRKVTVQVQYVIGLSTHGPTVKITNVVGAFDPNHQNDRVVLPGVV